MSETIQRKILVCAQQRCQRCKPGCKVVPDDCPSRILHLLETRTGGTQVWGRQTGKSRELVEIANALDLAGYLVYFISPTEAMLEHTRRNHRVNKSVLMMSWRQALRRMAGMAPGIILADEITPEELDAVKRVVSSGVGHLFLAHYWTPR